LFACLFVALFAWLCHRGHNSTATFTKLCIQIGTGPAQFSAGYEKGQNQVGDTAMDRLKWRQAAAP